jgi:hypothetical protein
VFDKSIKKFDLLSANISCIFYMYVYIADRLLSGIDYWTSGSSGKCNGTFVWCSHDELVDFATLDVIAPEGNQNNQCLFMTVGNYGSPYGARLMLKQGNCLHTKRAICVVKLC